MATYKKRGYKPKNKAEKAKHIEDESTTAEVFNTLDQTASKTEQWLEKNQKTILIAVGAIAVCVLGYLGYKEFVVKPKQVEATNEMFQAQQYFEQALNSTEKDSLFQLSLNGGQGQYGFLDIAEEYSGTSAGNIANYYAGIAYLNTGNYQKAIDHLDKFKSTDAILAPVAIGAIGDAFAQLGQDAEALSYYEQAAAKNDNELTAPRFLLKAGNMAIKLGNTETALKHYKKITDDYPKSTEANQAALFLGQAEAM
ncbi:MAG: tetratricopeptide repeat protein [Marinirhabdus sp.]